MSNNEKIEASYTAVLCLLFKVYSYINKREASSYWKRYLTSTYRSAATKFWILKTMLLWLSEIKIKKIMCISLFSLSQQEMLYFANDNADLRIDTPVGKNQLHGTLIMAYQNETSNKEESGLVILRNSKKSLNEIKIWFVKLLTVSLETNTECKNYVSLYLTDQVQFYSADDTIWSVLNSLSRATILPTWKGIIPC